MERPTLLLIISILLVGCNIKESASVTKKQLEKENKAIIQDEQYLAGKSIFDGCAVCHSNKEIAPNLCGIEDRQSREQIKKWISNSLKLIRDEKDPYAIKLYKKYNQNVMTSFRVSDDELNSLLYYLRKSCK